MDRRQLVAGGLALAAAGPVTVRAQAARSEWASSEAFEGLESFLALPIDQRSYFSLGYFISAQGRAANTIPVFLETPQGRAPVPVAQDGRLQRLPREEELKGGKLILEAPPSELPLIWPRIFVAVGAEPYIETAILDGALAQANAWLATKPLSGFDLKLEWVNFQNAFAGNVVKADGSKTPLPINPRPPHYEPAKYPGATAVELQLPPSMVFLSETNGPGPSPPARGLPPDATVQALMKERIDKDQLHVGLVVGLIDEKGRRVFAYGAADKSAGRPLDGKSVFEIGSITKVFTSLLLAQAVERGEVALDDPVAKHLPASAQVPQRNGKQITLIDLATHTSGLPRDPSLTGSANPDAPWNDFTVERLLREVRGAQLTHDIGARWEYSNLGAGLLSHALCLAAKTDFQTLLRQRITGPLGMASTTVALTPEMRACFVAPFDLDLERAQAWDQPHVPGIGALHADADDMLTFLAAELGYTDTPLKSAMAAQRVPRRADAAFGFQTLGWQIRSSRAGETFWHGGGTAGYQTYVGMDLRRKVGVVVLANGAQTSTNLGEHILYGAALQRRPVIDVPAAALAKYVGRWRYIDGMVVELSLKNGQLVAQAPNLRAKLYPTGPDQFYIRANGAVVSFETTTASVPRRATMRIGNQELTGERL